MENIFTPEEANKPVTYGDLAIILGETIKNLGQESIKYSDTLQENTFKLVNTMTDHMVKIRDNASYERQRDIRFVLGYLSRLCGCDKDAMYDNYMRWCEEFDKLNRPQTNSEDANG
jgi:hypothetical protein